MNKRNKSNCYFLDIVDRRDTSFLALCKRRDDDDCMSYIEEYFDFSVLVGDMLGKKVQD
jgi:hypothetical protein